MTFKKFFEEMEDWYATLSDAEKNRPIFSGNGHNILGVEFENDPMWGDGCFYIMDTEAESGGDY